jgi:hypothetical protein
MKDLELRLPNRLGALAELGEALGRAGVSLEGGGAWVTGGAGTAHFLVDDAARACAALKASGLEVVAVNEVLVQRLRQDRPGQLGTFTRRLAEAGVNITVLYSDHANQLIVVVDDLEKGRSVSEAWERER